MKGSGLFSTWLMTMTVQLIISPIGGRALLSETTHDMEETAAQKSF